MSNWIQTNLACWVLVSLTHPQVVRPDSPVDSLQALPGVSSAIQTRSEDIDARLLLSGRPVTRRLARGEIHSYEINLASGQFIRLLIDAGSVEPVVRILDPKGRELVSREVRGYRATLISTIAKATGAYRIRVEAEAHSDGEGLYELKIDLVRQSVSKDVYLVLADKSFGEGETLRRQCTAESLLKAIEKFKLALRNWRAANNPTGEADALRSIGEIYSSLSESTMALDHCLRALPLSGGPDQRALKVDLLNDIGAAAVDLGESQRAIESCNSALTLSREIGYARGEAHALNAIGLAYYDSGDLQKGLDSFRGALDISRANGDRRTEAQALNDTGYSYDDLGETRKALGLFEQALDAWRSAGQQRGQAQALTAIGGVHARLGETQQALQIHGQAAELFRQMGDRSGEAAALNGIGYVYDVLGDKRKALDLYNRARRLYRAAGNRRYEGITIGYIGRMLHALGDTDGALRFYNQKLALSRTLNDRRMEAYTLRDIGVTLDSFGQMEKALGCYEQSLAMSREVADRRGQAMALNNIGHVYARQSEPGKALSYFEDALVLVRAAEDRRAETLTLHNIARVERDLGNYANAGSRLTGLLDIVESLRTKVASQELRASYFASTHDHYELYIDVLMRMHKLNPSAGFAAAALEVSERARARGLIELLIEANADIREGVDPLLLRREREIQLLLNSKAERRIRLLNGKHTEEQATAIKKEIEDLTGDYQEIGAQIRATSPRYSALTRSRPLTVSEIQEQVLDDDSVLLEYSLGEERSYLWILSRTSISTAELASKSVLERAARDLRDSLASRSQNQKKQTAQQQRQGTEAARARERESENRLSKMLLGPVASLLKGKRIVVVSDGALQYVPFSALPYPPGSDSGGSAGEPLIANHEVISLPSASTLAVLRREIEGRRPAPKTLAVLADPVFEKDDVRVRPGGRLLGKERRANANEGAQRSEDDDQSPEGPVRFQRLPFAGDEAMAITRLVPEADRKLALGFEASRATAMSSEMANYRIVHFATHGLLDARHPELSGIVLSLVDQNGDPQDGFLRLNEVYNLRMPADLVVLSACQTALGKDIKGEGLVGLTRGFMYAGAARVVASLWKVDDRASAELMKYFYDEMLEHRLSASAALRKAQLAMRRQQRWSSAHYWAGFVLQGEWR